MPCGSRQASCSHEAHNQEYVGLGGHQATTVAVVGDDAGRVNTRRAVRTETGNGSAGSGATGMTRSSSWTSCGAPTRGASRDVRF